MKHQKSGCKSREFKALMATLFLGAFNDNIFKTIVSILVLTHFVSEDQGILYLSLTAGLFALPYILFSALAGFLADKFSKTKNIKLLKVFEILVMLGAFVAFSVNSTTGIMVSVFMMGLQSALFSPSKYGVLPEMLIDTEVSVGNGYTELYTFLAIIMGTAIAGVVLELDFKNPATVSLIVAIVGFGTSLFVGHREAAHMERRYELNPITPNLRMLKEIVPNQRLWFSVLGGAYFYFVGSMFQLNILVYAKETLMASELLTSLLLAVLAIGIGVGSIVAGKLTRGGIGFGLVPLGGFGLCILSFCLTLSASSYTLSLIIILIMGISGGLFIVPLNTYLQLNAPPQRLGGYLAASNFLTFCCIVFSSILFWVLSDLFQLSPSIIFTVMGGVSIFVSIYLIRMVPEIVSMTLDLFSKKTS